MNTLAQDFEAAWDREQGELRSFFSRQGVASSEIDDRLQDVAGKLWRQYSERGAPEDFSAYSRGVARYLLYDLRRGEMRRPELQYEPPEYFEKHGIPFADLWGRQVPSTRWDLAEGFSLLPLTLAETIDELESLVPRHYPILYYLSRGASLQEISELLDLPIPVLQRRLTQVKEVLRHRLSPAARRQYGLRIREAVTPPSWSTFPLQIQRFNAASYIRKLPGYVPEWIVWFSRLSVYITETSEPITFGVIRRLAQGSDILSEAQGRRFLLAITSEQSRLLTQKFFQIMPHGEPRLLSFSDISQSLRKETVVGDEGVAGDREWMDQIATAWEPTSKWRELTAWW
jgi:DNA-directed RNA polymerase specialized sigma24 family protein